MSFHLRPALASAAIPLAFLLLVGSAHALVAMTPDDICAPDADPCVISEAVYIDATEIDFGFRTVQIADGGTLLPGSFYGELALRCGGFSLDDGGQIDLGPQEHDFLTFGTELSVEVVGRCENAPETACDSDTDCVGSVCTGGDVALFGRIRGRAMYAGTFAVLAAGNIDAQMDANLSRRGREVGGGGYVGLHARGSLDVSGRIRVKGSGGIGLRGDEAVRATDVDLAAAGGYPGGFIVVESETGDVTLAGRVRGKPSTDLEVNAGRDAFLVADPNGEPTRLDLRGGGDFPFFAGNFDVDAGRDASIDAGVLIDQRGYASSGPYIVAEGDITFAGTALARGYMQMRTYAGSIWIKDTALLSLDVGEGASAWFIADGTVRFDGTLDAVSSGSPVSVALQGASGVAVSGALSSRGNTPLAAEYPVFRIDTCEASFEAGASMTTDAGQLGLLTYSGNLEVAAGASISVTGPDARVEMKYYVDASPPVLLGQVTPAPLLEHLDWASTCE